MACGCAEGASADVLKKAQDLDQTEHQMLPFIEKYKSMKEAVAKFAGSEAGSADPPMEHGTTAQTSIALKSLVERSRREALGFRRLMPSAPAWKGNLPCLYSTPLTTASFLKKALGRCQRLPDRRTLEAFPRM